ncbi:phosphatidylserine decarboxylase-domain-containing protein [Paraphysoderma sedebokerense]|nr:phosphatidylserine decarboxylase-domain-containing protein [Paraphysoderma sedebokerense]
MASPILRIQGRLMNIFIIEARNLAAKDIGGTSDPFAVVKFGPETFKTQVINKSLNPKWEREFEFQIATPAPLSVTITLWDKDIIKRDFLGRVHIPLSSFFDGNGEPVLFHPEREDGLKWMKLEKKSEKSVVSGDVKIKAGLVGSLTALKELYKSMKIIDSSGITKSMSNLSLNSIDESDVSTETKAIIGAIVVDVVGATDLPYEKSPTSFDMDAFVILSFNKAVYRTRVIRHNLNPIWNEKIVLPVPASAVKYPLLFSVYDNDRFTGNDYVGGSKLMVSDLVNEWEAVAGKEDGRCKELKNLKVELSEDYAGNFNSALNVRAWFKPIEALRRTFWISLVSLFDQDKSQTVNRVELEAMLDTINVDLTGPELESQFAKFGKQATDELTFDEVVTICEDLLKINSDKDLVSRLGNVIPCDVVGGEGTLKGRSSTEVILNMAIRLEAEPGEIDRFMADGFLTESAAQKKGLTKLIHKVTYGGYSIGADSANIIVFDRLTGQLIDERMPSYIRLGIRVLYRNIASKSTVESRAIKKMFLNMSVKQGAKYNDPKSKKDIEPFIKFHKLDMSEVRDPIESFKNFNEFFYRKLKEDARPLASDNPNVAVSAADCRLMAFQTVDQARQLWIKGANFTIEELLQDPVAAGHYVNGSVVIFRLAPQDYHRFHSPLDGTFSAPKVIPGALYTVNPMAIRSSIDVYIENSRVVSYIDSPQFGKCAIIFVGAMMVGSIILTKSPGPVKRGEELGYFAFGGSTVLLLLPPRSITLDADLIEHSNQQLETLVRVGMSIGKANLPNSKPL